MFDLTSHLQHACPISVLLALQEEGYQEALKCDGTDLDGQQLRVQKCVSAGQHAGKAKKPAGPSDPTDAAQPTQKQPPAPKVRCYTMTSLLTRQRKTSRAFL